jgi:hypothetical protein
MADLAVQLEAAHDCACYPMVEVALARAKGKMIDAPELQIIGAIVAGCRAILSEIRGVAEG